MASRRRCQSGKPGKGVEGWNTTSAHCGQAQTCGIRTAYRYHSFVRTRLHGSPTSEAHVASETPWDLARIHVSSAQPSDFPCSSLFYRLPLLFLSSSPAHPHIAQVPIRKSSQLDGQLERTRTARPDSFRRSPSPIDRAGSHRIAGPRPQVWAREDAGNVALFPMSCRICKMSVDDSTVGEVTKNEEYDSNRLVTGYRDECHGCITISCRAG
jgi:hypothetical protein